MKKILLIFSLLGLLLSSYGQLQVPAIASSVQVAAGYSAEYQAVYDQFVAIGETPHDTLATKQNTLVETLVSDGVWAKRDGIWLTAIHTNSARAAQINWKDPTSADTLVLEAGGASDPTFVIYEGFTTDGTNNYIDYGLGNLSGLTLYALNSASVCIYVRSHTVDAGASYLFGEKDYAGGQTRLYTNVSGGTWVAASVNSSSGVSDNSMSPSAGWYAVSRTASDSYFQMYNSSFTTDTDVSVQVAAQSMTFGAYNDGTPGNFAVAQYSYMSIGSGLSQAEAADERDAVEVYMDSNGKGVL